MTREAIGMISAVAAMGLMCGGLGFRLPWVALAGVLVACVAAWCQLTHSRRQRAEAEECPTCRRRI